MNETVVSILLAVVCILFSLSLIGYLIGKYVYRRTHGLPTGDCECCHINTKKLLKQYHKYKKL